MEGLTERVRSVTVEGKEEVRGRGTSGGPQCGEKRLNELKKKKIEKIGSRAWFHSRGHFEKGTTCKVWSRRGGQVVWEEQEERSPGHQVRGLAAN